MVDDCRWIDEKEVASVPVGDLPLLVLSYNYQSVIATLINWRRKSSYNHLMWMHRPGYFASQGAFYSEVPVKKYLKSHRLKFWTCKTWSAADRHLIISETDRWLKKPKLKTRYDFLAIAGHMLGLGGIIQNPFTRICSDYGSFLKLADDRYDLDYPAPDQVNQWLKKHSEYEVYCKYLKD